MRPELDDCCRSGCTPCVFDLYEDALERYRSALEAWEGRQAMKDRRQAC
ncbi:MAG: oxidoreductase-like domain-containing protein [Pseudomonadota bacterium]|nr:oxidoreductase-like domain-containing protein [Pseudomonadota bacterium]